MSYPLFAAGVLAVLATIGHFFAGYKMYIRPIIGSNADAIPKNVVLCLFHYMSVYLILTAIILLAFSFGYSLIFDSIHDVTLVIGISYAGFALVQLAVALTSSVKSGPLKMFQWIFWLLIALLSLVAA